MCCWNKGLVPFLFRSSVFIQVGFVTPYRQKPMSQAAVCMLSYFIPSPVMAFCHSVAWQLLQRSAVRVFPHRPHTGTSAETPLLCDKFSVPGRDQGKSRARGLV